MKNSLRLGLALVAFVGGGLLPASADSLDDAIIALMQKRHVPGLSLAVVKDGKIVRAQGYGVSGLGGEPVTADTLFMAGSVSKPVAAVGAMRLVEEGKLSLDDDVNGALKSWKVPDNEFTQTEKVTLRRLLSHTAGMTVHGFRGYAVTEEKPALLQVLNGEKPSNSPAIRVDVLPGSMFRYAGGGYSVMQQLVIDVSGEPSYPTFLRDTVLKPLGMTASTYEQPLPMELAAKTATGVLPNGKNVPGRWHVYPEIAAAGLWTTASDLARFVIGMQDALAGKPGTLLKPETARLMVTAVKGNYGLGFQIANSGKTQRFAHNGRDEGFDAAMVGAVETGFGAVVMINTNENSNFINQVLAAVVNEYHWPDYVPYRAPVLTPIEDKEPEVTARIKAIFEQAAKGTYERELFTEKLAAVLEEQVPRPEAIQRFQSWGVLKTITLIGKKADGGMRSYRYHLVYEKEGLLVNCSYDQDGKIAGLAYKSE